MEIAREGVGGGVLDAPENIGKTDGGASGRPPPYGKCKKRTPGGVRFWKFDYLPKASRASLKAP